MKHKVSELEGALLDAAVAKAEGLQFSRADLPLGAGDEMVEAVIVGLMPYSPTTNWADGCPIIERERICIGYSFYKPDVWVAVFGGSGDPDNPFGRFRHKGPTPLIAAMRAYVASKFGEEVELPNP